MILQQKPVACTKRQLVYRPMLKFDVIERVTLSSYLHQQHQKSSMTTRVVFEAEDSGGRGSKAGAWSPHPSLSPFPPLPLSIPLHPFLTSLREGQIQ